MKRILRSVFAFAMLAAVLALGAYAAEDVIYENDFSNPATLSDFKQYRAEWEIRDGGLYLTDKLDTSIPDNKPATTFSHIIYQAEKSLDEYIVEVDYMNIQTAGGIIFNADAASVGTGTNAFYGYLAFIANDAAKGALGCADAQGSWKGNINVGSNADCSLGTNAHIKVTVKGGKIHVEITNLDSGKTIYDYVYTMGDSDKDERWVEGTVGFRMRAEYAANLAVSAGNAYFDNLKITTAREAVIESNPVTVVPGEKAIDTSSLKTVYENSFDDLASIADFTQYRGSWDVRDGRLYLTAVTGGHSFILYTGDSALTSLTDYVLDVDMYNTQTQGGAIVRSDLNSISDTDNGMCGYIGFISFDGKLGAVGYGKSDGAWGGNIEVSPAVLTPGSNIHLQIAVKGDMIQYIMTDLQTGNEIWSWSGSHTTHTAGSFGFRLYGKVKDGLNNLNATSFDNLKISTYAENKPVDPVDTPKFTASRTYQNQFADVAEGQWFHSFVKTAYEYALANGTSETKFSPDGKFTVAQALTAAVNIHKAYNGTTVRAAAAGEAWYAPYVEYCVQNGIIKDGQFTNLDANITRGDMAVVFANILPDSEYKAIREKTLPDMTAGTASAAAVQKLANAGIVGGDDKGNFNPANEITRAEACVIFTRIAVADMRDAK